LCSRANFSGNEGDLTLYNNAIGKNLNCESNTTVPTGSGNCSGQHLKGQRSGLN
jgi:hypothetical protein